MGAASPGPDLVRQRPPQNAVSVYAARFQCGDFDERRRRLDWTKRYLRTSCIVATAAGLVGEPAAGRRLKGTTAAPGGGAWPGDRSSSYLRPRGRRFRPPPPPHADDRGPPEARLPTRSQGGDLLGGTVCCGPACSISTPNADGRQRDRTDRDPLRAGWPKRPNTRASRGGNTTPAFGGRWPASRPVRRRSAASRQQTHSGRWQRKLRVFRKR